MSEKYTYYNGDLYHHGVKGQKWGVRRFQNTDGSLTPAGKAKLKKYKETELKALAKRHLKTADRDEKRLEKLTNKVNKAIDEHGNKSKQAQRASKRYFNEKARQVEAFEIGKAEVEKIKNMSYEDMRKEKASVGKKQVLAGLANAGSTMAFIFGSPVAVFTGVNRSAVKTNMRVSAEERAKARKKGYQVAGNDLYG